jgi:amino-acid N-acetyltransferase
MEVMAEWKLSAARARDLEAAEELLEACELAAGSVRDQFGEGYVVAERQGELIGLAGVEMHGRHGLLRSVAVAATLRGSGLGAALVRDRITWAREHGLESIYLLTTTAAEFFARHGFEVASRDDAPAEIRASKEFSEMCPSTAVFMKLARGGA